MDIDAEVPRDPAKSIFLGALEFDSLEERTAFLRKRCGEDSRLRRLVEEMLRHHTALGDYLEQPLFDPSDLEARLKGDGIGASIGPYKLLERIGEGGMGIVYSAEQTEPIRRRVALKLIKPGMDTKRVVARFAAERQTLAIMDHPNIAKVHDAGATASGRSFFVMELIDGIPITEFRDRERLSIPKSLELFMSACRAVQHAHQKGIIHRDIKPSNIIVTSIDGVATPKVIDFGVAKATDDSLVSQPGVTGVHDFLGTPLYMSPEQADPIGLDVDTRGDVYSLGVVLHEMVVGVTPFDAESFRGKSLDEVRRILREVDPPKPFARLRGLGEKIAAVSAAREIDARQLERLVKGELGWIIMRAIEKDRRSRYQSVGDLISDLARWTGGFPVEACPPRLGYKIGKFAARHRFGLVFATTIVILLLTGFTTSLVLAYRATRAEAAMLQEKNQAEFDLGWMLAGLTEVVQKLQDPRLESSPTLKSFRKELADQSLETIRNYLERIGAAREPHQRAVPAYIKLAEAYAHMEDHEAALDAFDRAIVVARRLLAARPNDALSAYQLGHALGYRGTELRKVGREKEAGETFIEAERAYRLSVHLDPDNEIAVNMLAWFLLTCVDPARHNHPEALQIARSMIARSPRPKASQWNTRALAEYRAGGYRDAVVCLNRQKSLRPENLLEGEDLMLLALCHHHLGEFNEATNAFEQASLWYARNELPRSQFSPIRAEAETTIKNRNLFDIKKSISQ